MPWKKPRDRRDSQGNSPQFRRSGSAKYSRPTKGASGTVFDPSRTRALKNKSRPPAPGTSKKAAKFAANARRKGTGTVAASGNAKSTRRDGVPGHSGAVPRISKAAPALDWSVPESAKLTPVLETVADDALGIPVWTPNAPENDFDFPGPTVKIETNTPTTSSALGAADGEPGSLSLPPLSRSLVFTVRVHKDGDSWKRSAAFPASLSSEDLHERAKEGESNSPTQPLKPLEPVEPEVIGRPESISVRLSPTQPAASTASSPTPLRQPSTAPMPPLERAPSPTPLPPRRRTLLPTPSPTALPPLRRALLPTPPPTSLSPPSVVPPLSLSTPPPSFSLPTPSPTPSPALLQPPSPTPVPPAAVVAAPTVRPATSPTPLRPPSLLPPPSPNASVVSSAVPSPARNEAPCRAPPAPAPSPLLLVTEERNASLARLFSDMVDVLGRMPWGHKERNLQWNYLRQLHALVCKLNDLAVHVEECNLLEDGEGMDCLPEPCRGQRADWCLWYHSFKLWLLEYNEWSEQWERHLNLVYGICSTSHSGVHSWFGEEGHTGENSTASS